MVAILTICWHFQSRYNLDENELEQREIVGNMNDDTDEKLLNQVGNAMHIVLNEFPPRRFGEEKGNVVLQFFRRCNARGFYAISRRVWAGGYVWLQAKHGGE